MTSKFQIKQGDEVHRALAELLGREEQTSQHIEDLARYFAEQCVAPVHASSEMYVSPEPRPITPEPPMARSFDWHSAAFFEHFQPFDNPHFIVLEDYLHEKKTMGVVGNIVKSAWPKIVVSFETYMGTMRQVLEPWLREHVKEFRLKIMVQVWAAPGVRKSDVYSRKEQRRLPRDTPVVVHLKIVRHYKVGRLQFMNRFINKSTKRGNNAKNVHPSRTRPAKKSLRAAREHAKRHGINPVRRHR